MSNSPSAVKHQTIREPAKMATTTVDDGSLPSTMRAWTYTQPGRPSAVLTLTKSHPAQHKLQSNEVLIKISHCGFNAGVLFMIGLLPSWLHKTPAVPELDLSGEIVATASARSHLKIGAQVFGSCPPALFFRYGKGSLAAYVVLPTGTIVPIPTNMSLEKACGLSGCGCTAVQLVRKANIKRGDSVLINGGSGGLGSVLVQVVKAAVGETGRVVATCSSSKSEFVKSLGADEVIDYTAFSSLSLHLVQTYSSSRLDTVLDTVGIQSLYTASPVYLKPSGFFINAGGMTVPPKWIPFLGLLWMMLLNYMYPSFLPNGVPRKYAFLSGYADQHDSLEVKRLVEAGKLTVHLDSVWEMEDALKAYERIESKRATGKVMVHVQNL